MTKSKFWKDRKVLVTGGAGFIGSHLVEKLIESQAKPVVPVRSLSKIDNLKTVRKKINLVKADLFDFKACLRITQGIDLVMNLAADVGGIEYNIKHPASIFRNNVQPFLNILEAARINKVGRFLVVSSACVYPRFCTVPTPEEEGFKDMPEPTNEGYGFAKRTQEFLGQKYAQQYKMKIGIARPYNAYGPRDHFEPERSHVIPALIKRVFDGENPLVVWGSGNQSRAFLYVDDFARGLMEVIEKYPQADPVNIGTSQETKIKDLVKLIVKLSGKNPELVFDVSKPEGQPRRNCETQKAKNKVGFEAGVSLTEGLKKTIEWYRENKS